MSKPHPRKSRSLGVTKLSPNTNMEAKLTHASMLLGYLFDDGVDFQRRVINLTGDIDEDTFKLIDAALSEMEAESRKAVTIKINSTGGAVYQAMAIVGRLRESKCRIITQGYGTVMSAATLILACGHKRKISEYSVFMHHEMSYELGDQRHSQAKAYVEQAEREHDMWASWMERFTNKPASFWKEQGVVTDAHFTAEELLELGVVDELF